MMDSESATPVDKTATPSASEAPPSPPPPAAAELSDTSDSDSDDQKPQVEWLATARERRSTAGNRMKSMLAAEEPDDDLELLFAEDENDQGFSDAGDDGSDVHMDSSSDDEDNNNAGDADEMEGEKELEKQAKERRAAQRKRKAQDAIPAKFRKKVRINTEAPPPRPKKKSERASWLPSVADLPTRASARSTTRMSKEQLHTQMVEREARRLKQVAQMQKKAAKLEAMRKPPMTQEERLKEAEKVEMRNRGSLNRWEEAEKAREEERLRKLKALTERRLEGPVITFWSGVREGQGPRYVEMEEKPVRKKKEKPAKGKASSEKKEGDVDQTPKPEEPADAAAKDVAKKAEPPQEEAGRASDDTTAKAEIGGPEAALSAPTLAEGAQGAEAKEAPDAALASLAETKGPAADPEVPGERQKPTETLDGVPAESAETKDGVDAPDAKAAAVSQPTDTESSDVPAAELAGVSSTVESATTESHAPDAALSVPALDPETSAPKPASVLAAPVLAKPPSTANPTSPSSSSSVLAAPDTTRGSLTPPAPQQQPQQTSSEAIVKDAVLQPKDAETTASSTVVKGDGTDLTSATPSEQPVPKTEQQPDGAMPVAAEGVTESVKAPRNAIIFQNFNEAVIRDKSIQTQILFGQKMAKLSKPAPNPVCVITNRPARYRDPSTGLPFATAHAYHEIRRLIKGEYKWSRLLGAWVGTGAYAARGVPDRFLNPNAEGPVREKKNGEDDKGKETDDGNDKKGESQKEKEDGNVESEAKAGPSLDVAMGGTEVVAA